MFGTLKRLFSKDGAATDVKALAEWAMRRGHSFRRARGDAGFVIEGRLESRPWRLEWGPSQRPYIDGRELRLRMELQLPADQQMLLLSRPLMDSLESQTYEKFTDDVQTEMGGAVPEEMRWLVMFSKVDLAALDGLGQRFGAVASQPSVGLAWIEGPLANLLLREATAGVLRGEPPLVLMTLRGNVYLRLQLGVPDTASIAAALGLFETAVAGAVAAAGAVTDTSIGWSAGASSAWQSIQPDEEGGPRKRR